MKREKNPNQTERNFKLKRQLITAERCWPVELLLQRVCANYYLLLCGTLMNHCYKSERSSLVRWWWNVLNRFELVCWDWIGLVDQWTSTGPALYLPISRLCTINTSNHKSLFAFQQPHYWLSPQQCQWNLDFVLKIHFYSHVFALFIL